MVVSQHPWYIYDVIFCLIYCRVPHTWGTNDIEWREDIFRSKTVILTGARHKKTDIKVFVVVMTKERLAGWARQSFFGFGSTTEFYSQCHAQRSNGGAPAHHSFFSYDNDKDLKVCFLMT